MKVQTGIDLVRMERIRDLDEQARSRVFHPSEMHDNVEHLAGIFAAKEACFKALSLDTPAWMEIEITHEKNGKPAAILSDRLSQDIASIEISISHEADLAVAVAVLITK